MAKLYMLLALGAALQLAVQGAPHAKVCHTSQCRQTANSILKDMHATADPCVDFNKFACGGYKEREKLLEGEKRNDYLTFIAEQNLELVRTIATAKHPKAPKAPKGDLAEQRNLQKLQSFYGACMDETRLQKIGRKPLQDEIRKMTQIYPGPHSTGVPGGDREAISKLLGYNMKNGFENFFGFDLWDDTENHGYKIMTVQQTGLGLGEDALYSDEKIVKLYEKVIGQMFYIIQGGGDPKRARSMVVPKTWKRVAKEVVAFEKILAGIVEQPETKEPELKVPEPKEPEPKENDPAETDEEAPVEEEEEEEKEEEEEDDGNYWDTIEDLTAMTPALDWKVILETAFPKDVAIPTQYNMLWKFYLTRMNKAVEQTAPKTIQNYFAWTLIRNLGKNLADSFQGPLKELARALPGANTAVATPRWKTCVETVNTNVGDLAGHFFVKSIFPETSQKQVNEMITSIRWSFEKNFWQYDWLDPRTRTNAIQKLKAIVQKVGYSTVSPNVISSTSVDKYYHKLKIQGKDHFGNLVRASAWKAEMKHRGVHLPVNRLKLEPIPQTVNAFYNPTQNSIEIMAGLLRSPFFNMNEPEYLNFAGIGQVAAHELGHAFDNSGRSYDETGALRDWWEPSSVEAFDNKTMCFIEQYGKYTIKGPDGKKSNVNGWTTLGENIADNGGIKLAFEAWRQRYRSGKRYNNARLPGLERYTPEQLFFIQFARSFCGNMSPDESVRMLTEDSHSPREYRINGVVQNSAYFAQAFKCKSGTPMNPVNKCILW
ncbi:Endothelin-converting enzyme 2 [Mortierella antarctica]|nr:Endothelin-converting enzyme 2 [Mortierella antarctica]